MFPVFAQAKAIIIAVIVGLLLAAVAGAWLYVQSVNKTIEKLRTENTTLIASNKIYQENNDVMKENMKRLAVANHSNWLTAQQLIEERSKAQTAINNLASATASDRQVISRLNKKLDEVLKDPKNDGLVAPALRETVRDVQATRKQR